MRLELLVAVLALIASATGPARASASNGGRGRLELPASLQRLLASGRWDSTAPAFRMVALSFLADGCVAEARRDPAKQELARACVARTLELAGRTRSGPLRPDTDDGLWLTHYSLILGAADALGPCAEPARHEAIAASLAARSLRDPHRHVASYARLRNRWPADQAATLASLARFDRAHGTRLLDEAARAWRDHVLAHAMDRRLGLPWSEVTGADRTAREPRGCALSWQTRFLHEFDESLARRWWAAYRSRFLVERLGLAGFREWAPGHDHAPDADSGPIVDGVGAAATGLGIAAARAMGEDELAEHLVRTATVVGATARWLPGASGALPDAIRYLGAQLRR